MCKPGKTLKSIVSLKVGVLSQIPGRAQTHRLAALRAPAASRALVPTRGARARPDGALDRLRRRAGTLGRGHMKAPKGP